MGSDSDSPKVENVSESEVNQVLARQLQANPEKVKSIINSIDIEGTDFEVGRRFAELIPFGSLSAAVKVPNQINSVNR